jgi:hypothetical protein
MTATRIKLGGTEATINSTSNNSNGNAGGARLIRIVASTGNTVLTQFLANGSTVGSMTLLAGQEVFIEKGGTDYFTASANIVAVAVGFRN